MQDEKLWPPGEKAPDFEKLADFVAENADAKTKELVEQAKRDAKAAEKIAQTNGDVSVHDMSEEVLDGRLGEICQRHMLSGARFPLAYAWPALLAAASTVVPRRSEKQRLNVYVALVGEQGSGKSQAIAAVLDLIGVKAPVAVKMYAGSAEILARRLADANGANRLFVPDELGHMLDKAKIENAAFPFVLNTAFYEMHIELRGGKREDLSFNASLSILGGIVTRRFDELFSHATTGGMYGRFIFGLCPSSFRFDYYEIDDLMQSYDAKQVGVHPDVWTEKALWLHEDRELSPRVVELGLRAAQICASFDGRTLLRVEDLKPARAFIDYQMRVRRFLQPNEGENAEAKVALKVLAYLDALGGKYVEKRKMLMDIGAYRFGPSVAQRALKTLFMNDEIYIDEKNRPVTVRRIMKGEEDENH